MMLKNDSFSSVFDFCLQGIVSVGLGLCALMVVVNSSYRTKMVCVWWPLNINACMAT